MFKNKINYKNIINDWAEIREYIKKEITSGMDKKNQKIYDKIFEETFQPDGETWRRSVVID